MKNLIMLLFGVFLFTSVNAQNGGQHFENNSVKIEQVGLSLTGQAIVKTTNKQTCFADIKVSFGSNDTRTKNIVGLGSDTFHITIPQNRKVQAKTETNCGSADFGQVELTLSSTSLPISSISISYKRVNSNTFILQLNLGTVDGTNNEVRVNIRPKGSSTTQQIKIPIPDGLSNKTYDVTLTYKNNQWVVIGTK